MARCCEGFEVPIRIPDSVQPGVAEPSFARAGAVGRWRLNFVLSRDIPPNGEIHFCLFGHRNIKNRFENLQFDDPAGEGFVSLGKKDGGPFEPVAMNEAGEVIVFRAPPAGLRAGEKIVADLGGRAGTRAPLFSNPAKFFLLLSKVPGENLTVPCLFGEVCRHVIGACLMEIAGADMKRISVIAESAARPGEPTELLIRPEDAWGNVSSEKPRRLTVWLDEKRLEVECSDAGGSACRVLRGIRLGEGVHRLLVTEESKGIEGVSNPIVCSGAPRSHVPLWGMIHGHTEISDGTASLDHYFSYMRNEAGLDFGATGDHDHLWETSDEMWELTQRAVMKHNDPGRFTTFLGYEWAKWRQNGDGDRNVYYLEDARPMYRSDDGCFPTPKDLFDALKRETAIIIPHHSANRGNHCDWKDHDPEKERLVEIYSVWGSSERAAADGNPLPIRRSGSDESWEVPLGVVQRALALGWRVGFTAGGDDHFGHPGDQIRGARYKAGLFAVWAEANTRESIWDALWNRRCYGTTGARIWLEFHLDGCPMGSELSVADRAGLAARRRLSVRVHGTDKIKSVEVVRNNEDVYRFEGDGSDAAFEWTDEQPLDGINIMGAPFCPSPFTFYYVRVTQADGEMAWASPVWVTAEG